MPSSPRFGPRPYSARTDDPGRAYGVGHAEHQRHLGADHDQVGGHLAGQGDDALTRGDVDVMLLGQSSGSGIARSDEKSRYLWISTQRQQQGMFTGTGADHQDAHETSL